MQWCKARTPYRPAAAGPPPAARPGQPKQQRTLVKCGARPDSPYEPLERAIQVINRVIALGEKAKWGSDEQGPESSSGATAGGSSTSNPARERWVQFAAVYNSSLGVDQPAPGAAVSASTQRAGDAQGSWTGDAQQQGSSTDGGGGGGSGGSSQGRQLRDYLALPIEQYSLLDPKWISREEGGTFRFSLPLQDLVNVELQPEIYISVLREPQEARVTLSGTRAALGSPEIDAAFRLNVTAVVSQRQRRRLPAMPDHLPGRPVMRLRRWAAAARGRPWPPPEASASVAVGGEAAAAAAAGMAAARQAGGSSSGSSNGSSAAPEVVVEVPAADDGCSVVPFPGQHVYISHDENDSDEYDEADGELAAAELEGSPPAGYSSSNGRSGGVVSSSTSSGGGGGGGGYESSSAALSTQQTAADAAGQQQDPPPGPRALLHCRTRVTMAVRVPGPLKVVPNALLGYAGSLLLRTILSATLPNFLSLLAADYRRWAGIAGTGDSSARQLDAPVGELFSDAAAAVQEGRQRRQQQHGGEEEQQQQQQEVEGQQQQQQQQQQQDQGEEPAAPVQEGQPAAAGEVGPSQEGQQAAAGEHAQPLC